MSTETIIDLGDGITSDVGVWDSPVGGGNYNGGFTGA